MSLAHKFRGAKKIIHQMGPPERATLKAICKEIHVAQQCLVQTAQEPLGKCIEGCEGLCCKNAQVDDIIGTPDFIYLLTTAPQMSERIEARLVDEDPLYSADCIFLENSTGPCMFPEAVRPEVCITTFCGDHRSVRMEISRLKRKFFKLGAFIRLRRPRRIVRALCSLVNGNASGLLGGVLYFLAIPLVSL
jgi:hypothetical protein